jgi:hypothetical protein
MPNNQREILEKNAALTFGSDEEGGEEEDEDELEEKEGGDTKLDDESTTMPNLPEPTTVTLHFTRA